MDGELDRENTSLLQQWIATAIEPLEEFERDSIHIDELSPAYRPREEWGRALLDVLFAAEHLCGQRKWPVEVGIGLSYIPRKNPTGVAPTPFRELLAQADWAPPNLFVFKHTAAPWNEEGVTLSRNRETTPRGEVVVIRGEWFDDQDREYRSAVWLVIAHAHMDK